MAICLAIYVADKKALASVQHETQQTIFLEELAVNAHFRSQVSPGSDYVRKISAGLGKPPVTKNKRTRATALK